MEKYFCGTSLSYLIYVTVCEKAAEYKVFITLARGEATDVAKLPSHGRKPDSSAIIKIYPDFS